MAQEARRLDAQPEQTLNPITAEVIRHHLLSIPNQIDVNITRTAYSPLVYEMKDYAVGIVDPEGRLIAQSDGGIPIFVANALGVAVRDGLKVQGRENIHPGDVLITNHAGTLGQHLNNVVMYAPVFVGDELVAFMAVLVHWIDVGGQVVGSASVNTTEIYQEGFQFRSVKFWSRGEPVKDIIGIIESNTRFPRMLFGDIRSQLAGCLLGRDMVRKLVEKYSIDTFRAAVNLMWDRADAAARAAIAKIPDGVYKASSFLDSDGLDLNKPIPVEAKVTVSGDEIEIDLTGCGAQTRGPINSGYDGGAVAVARIACKFLIEPNEPTNEGSFQSLHVKIPDGTFLSASADAAMGMYSTPLPTVIDTIVRALGQAVPDRAAGGHHSNFAIHSIGGKNEKTGQPFFNLATGHGGWGGSLGHDGPGPYKTMSHGDTLDVSVESQEALFPLRIDSLVIRTDSAGAGEFRGGVGVDKLVTALGPCTVKFSFDRTVTPPWGVLGGHDAGRPAAFIERDGETPQKVLKGSFALKAGDKVRVVTTGGGGYGDPLRRDPDKVASDVRLGYTSREAAQREYGVIIGDDGEVDRVATARRRQLEG